MGKIRSADPENVYGRTSAGYPVFFFIEAEMARLKDYYQDSPEGMVAIHPEQEDVRNLRALMPKIAFAGGMSSNLLASGTQGKICYSQTSCSEGPGRP